MEIFQNFLPISNCFENLTKIETLKKSKFFKNLDQNRNFAKIFTKIWQKAKFSKKKNLNFSNIRTNRKFSKFSKKIDRNFWKILTKIENFRNFDQNFFSKMWLKSKFFKNLTEIEIFEKIEIFRKFSPKSKYFENLTKSRFCENFWLKSKLFEICEKLEMFESLTKIEIFRIFD